jgi:localization factor PodJL
MNARAAIVAAAEVLYQRGGADAVTLSAVAREVNFARGTIYAHFASRRDLVALVAPPDEVPPPDFSPLPEPESLEPVSLETPELELQEAALPAEPAPPEPALADPLPSDPEPSHPSSDVPSPQEAENYDTLMRAQAEALQEITKQVIVPKPRTATDAALSRLDARLSVAEKSLQALEQRMGERLKGLDVDTGALAERLHGLRQRLEKFEERQTAALAQIRLDVHNLQIGKPAFEPIRGPQPLPEPEIVPQDEPSTEGETPAEPAVDGEPVAPAGQSVRVADYLMSARRAANDAAERLATRPAPRKPAWLRFFSRNRWLILAAAAALIGWFDVYVFAHYQPAEGRAVPAAETRSPSSAAAKREWSPRAQLVRGLKYLNGTGVPVDLAKARVWIESAALRGHPVAKNLMGVLYQSGTGVGVNIPMAIGWYEGAAKAGNLKAMTNLGKLYAGGWPQGTDFGKAAEWFARSAACGDVDAAFNLAVLYERGAGVVRNLPQAYKWYAIAARQGDRNAAARAQTLAAELAPEEREAADAAAMAFRPTPVNAAANETPATSG